MKLVGLESKYDQFGELYFANMNFTSTEYYKNTWMMSHFPKYWYFLTIGSRGRGKTYEGKQYCIKDILQQLSDGVESSQLRKFMWWRLTGNAVDKMLQNNGATFFEKQLLEQYQIRVKVKNNDIYFARWCDDRIDEESGDIEYVWHHVGKAVAIQEYYKYKGNQLNEYDIIVMDELVRAASEKRTFNIPAAFVNMIENVARKRKGIRVMIYANAIGEMHEVKQLFGFMPLPGRFGVYKLFHKRAIIEYLDDSQEWKTEQASTMAGLLATTSEFTNSHVNSMEDKENYFIQRKLTAGKRYFASIKIDRGRWLDIYTFRSKYWIDVEIYTSAKMKRTNPYALDRELVTPSTIYSKEIIKFIKQIWELGDFRFSSPIIYEWFYKQLQEYSII